jgi:hypothetical protein
MVSPYIRGVQQNGVAACVKHFALNNHEVNRHTTNVIVDDRALYEIYLPAFKMAVQEGGAWSIMGAYNLYKGQHLCHNQYTLNDILKGEWGFDGVVISDWGGTHDTRQAITNGLDMEFGSWTNGLSNGASNAYDNYYLANPYLNLIREGKVGTKELDDKVRRILRLIFRTVMNPDRPWGSMLSPEHYEAARRIGEEGIVLLQNKGNVLPIDLDQTKKILVVGENAIKMMTVGGGSSSLKESGNVEVLPIGKRSAEYFAHHEAELFTQEVLLAADISVGQCFQLARQITEGYRKGEFDAVKLCYTRFDSMMTQTAVSIEVLPLAMEPTEQQKAEARRSQILYKPSSEEVFSAIIPEYVAGVVYGAVCESVASELAARRTAMDAATKNAGEMIDHLNLYYNRARQAAITQEITEIVAGAEN